MSRFSDAQIKETFTAFQTVVLTSACVTSVISFATLADTKDYKDACAYRFTVAAGVLTWIYLLFIIFVPTLNNMGVDFPFVDLEGTVRQGSAFSALIAYTAAVACQSISSDIDEAIFDDEEDSGRVCRNGFCAKVYTACVFMWFTAALLVLAVADKESTILDTIGLTTPKAPKAHTTPYLHDDVIEGDSVDVDEGQPYDNSANSAQRTTSLEEEEIVPSADL